MTIMFSVLRGMRPDTSLDSLSQDIPGRETLISLMTSGWTSNPDERPSFLSKLTQLTALQELIVGRIFNAHPSQKLVHFSELLWPFSQFGVNVLMLSNRRILLITAKCHPDETVTKSQLPVTLLTFSLLFSLKRHACLYIWLIRMKLFKFHSGRVHIKTMIYFHLIMIN